MIKISKQNDILKNRIEILFLYDVRDANPNGDPDNNNMPRIDEISGENIVTDVRLKRTIRDYWKSKGLDVLVKAVDDDKGNRQSMDERVRQELNIGDKEEKNQGKLRGRIATELPERFIDVRCFGAAVTLKNANTSITGPVQFGLGRSLNIPQINTRTITTTLASGSEKGMGAIGEYHTVDYSLIKFHGLISEATAKETNFSLEDLKLLYEGLWFGTKQLNTRSKFNHVPRLLIGIVSKENNTQIGDIDLYVKINGNRQINSFDKVELDITEFIKRIKQNESIIEKIELLIDPELKLAFKDKMVENILTALKEIKSDINIEDLIINGE